MHLVYSPKFCKTIVFDLSWDDCKYPGENGEIGGVNKLHCGICKNSECTKTT